MRRNYISPEFIYNPVFGTFNMKEQSTFFSSKMIEIDDILELHNQGLIYYQNGNKEQLDFDIEKSLSPIVYSVADDKNKNHQLIIDDSQTDFQRNNLTKYILTIDLKTLLNNFLFATLKQYRTFEGVRNNMCYSNDVSYSIKEYITKNITDRYKFSKVELYLKYIDLREQNIRRFSNTWNSSDEISQVENQLKKIETQTEYDFSSVRVSFNQEKSSQQYSFEYYFKLFWEKV
jgi:hypothetical protein